MKSEQVRNVLRAVTENGWNIILTAVLGILLIYVYTIIGFFLMKQTFPDGVDINCETLGYCLATIFEYGIRSGGGIGDVLGPVDVRSRFYWGRFFYDVSFFMIIIIIILNVVFGIILDTFGELRDKRNSIDEDIRERCFICSLDSDTFQRQSLGFQHHIDNEHNTWNYLHFLIYLKNKDVDEYTFLEEYVSEKRKRGEIEWFPVGKAISIESFLAAKKGKSKKGKTDKESEKKSEKKSS